MSESNLGTARFIITGNASGAASAAAQANAALSTMEQAVAQNWWGLRNLGMAFAALPAAVAAGVGAAVKAAIAWENAMAGVEKTTYDTNDSVEENRKNLAELEKQLIDLARTKPIASVEIAGIAEAGAALGVAQGDLKEYTATVADLAATSDYTADAAGTDLARIAALTGVPAAGFDNLASSILETGRATAATEPEIGAIATRISGLHGTFGLSAQEIIGFSAALRSSGVNAELAGTNLQKTFIDISQAVHEGGADLEGFAKVAGVSSKDFAAKFKSNASGAFTDFVLGLSKMQTQGQDTVGTLADLGITEQRQIRLLTLLSTAQNSTSNENIKLVNIQNLANKSYKEGTAVADIAAKRYATFSSQVQILKNNFFEVASEVGGVFLPVLKGLATIVQSAVAGFRAMPGPLKFVLAAIIGLATAFSLIGAAALLLLPRIVQTRLALRSIGEQYQANKSKAIEAALAVEQHGNALVEQQVAANIAVNASKAHEVALNASVIANERAAAAEAVHAQAVLGIGEALSAAGTAEAAYTRAQIAMTNARINIATIEADARAAGGYARLGGTGVLEAADRKLADAQRQLAGATAQVKVAQDGLTASQTRAAEAAAASAEAQRRAAVAENELASAKQKVVLANAEELVATGAVDAAQERHVAATGRAIVVQNALNAVRSRGQVIMAGFTKGLGYASIAMVAFTAYTTIMGNAQRKAEEKLRHQGDAVKKLVAAYVSGDKAGRKTIDGYVKQQIAEKNLAESARKLGISRRLLNSAIEGTISTESTRKFFDAIYKGDQKGIKGAREFGAEVHNLNRRIANSKEEALVQGASFDFVSGKSKKAATAAKEYADALEDVDAATAKATATTDYIEAMFSEQAAAFDVADAQQGLDEARREGAKTAQEIQKAELSLIGARATAARSADAIAAAERDLSTARARQDEAVAKASLSLADANDRHLDAIDKVSDAQKTLNELRNPKETDDLVKAVESLRDAEKSVRDAQQKGADAQWYLNYLREEGAGKRDIKVATNAQKDAADELAKATGEQADAQKELSKVTDPAEKAKEIAKAERDLAAARRDVQSSALGITEAERGLSEARADKASNKLVRDAENALQDARLQSRSDALSVKDAEDALGEARRKSADQGIIKAQYDLEQAYYKQAQAIAETRKQQALMNGETFTAKDDANNLALALQQVVDSMPDGTAKKNLQGVIDVLKKTPDIPKTGPEPAAEEAATGPVDIPEGFAGKDPFKGLAAEAKSPSLLETIKKNLGATIGLAIVGVGVAIGGPIAILGAVIVGGLVFVLTKFGPGIAKAIFSFIKDIPKNVKKIPKALKPVGRAIGDFFKKLPGRLGFAAGFLLGFIVKAVVLFIGGLVKLSDAMGRALKKAFRSTLNFFKTLFSDEFRKKITSSFRRGWKIVTTKAFWADLWDKAFNGVKKGLKAGNDALNQIGKDFLNGIIKGIEKSIPDFGEDLKRGWQVIVDSIKEFFGIKSPSTVMAEIGGFIIEGLFNGIVNGVQGIYEFFIALPGRVIAFIGNAAETLLDVGGKIIGGLFMGISNGWNAVVEWVRSLGRKIVYHAKKAFGLLVKGGGVLIQAGKDVIGGFLEGLKEIWKDVVGWVSDAADHLPGVVKKVLGISSPSKVFRKLGLAVGQGLNEGVQASMKDTAKNFEKSVKAITPDLIQKQFESFGLTGLDVAAYAGTGPTSRAPIAAPAPPAVLAGANAQDRAPVHNDIDYNLTAMTDADPKTIFDRFAWEEKIKTRGNGNYR